MTRPNFFLVGAPKCGTTAMAQYLGAHPDIFMPDKKEPHFFGTDLRSDAFLRDRDAYLALFDAAEDAKRVGEASVWYLYSKRAAVEIQRFSPEADILVMLRNPVEVLYSQHSQFLYNGNEDLADFAAALDAEEDRRAGRRIPPTCMLVEGLFYLDTVRFAEQLRRYFDAFGPDRVHVILFDDFRADTAAAYRATLAFLGVDPDFAPSFEVVNPNKQVRSRFLRNLQRGHCDPLQRVLRALLPSRALRDALRGGLRRLSRYNLRRTARPPMDPALRQRLQAQLEPEIERLETLIGRDLSHWIAMP